MPISPMKYTPKRYEILNAIAHWKLKSVANTAWKRLDAPDHHNIAVLCGHGYHAADWAHSTLRQLEAAGYIEVASVRLGARTWKITKRGAEVLAKWKLV